MALQRQARNGLVQNRHGIDDGACTYNRRIRFAEPTMTRITSSPNRSAGNTERSAATGSPGEPRTTLKDLAYAQLEEAIVTLKLAPGAVVSELAMSEMTVIGRTPTREAIQRLAQEGLIVVLPQRGLLIAEMDV